MRYSVRFTERSWRSFRGDVAENCARHECRGAGTLIQSALAELGQWWRAAAACDLDHLPGRFCWPRVVDSLERPKCFKQDFPVAYEGLGSNGMPRRAWQPDEKKGVSLRLSGSPTSPKS